MEPRRIGTDLLLLGRCWHAYAFLLPEQNSNSRSGLLICDARPHPKSRDVWALTTICTGRASRPGAMTFRSHAQHFSPGSRDRGQPQPHRRRRRPARLCRPKERTDLPSGWAGPALLHRRVNLSNPVDNAELGAALLRSYLDRLRDPKLALAAYYQGLSGVLRYGIYPSSRTYVNGIWRLRNQFQAAHLGA